MILPPKSEKRNMNENNMEIADRKGEESEFGKFYETYKTRFENFAYGYVQDSYVAEDIVTDSFVYFWENRSKIDDTYNPAAYVLTTIRHKSLNYLRDLRTRTRIQNHLGQLQQRIIDENIRSLEQCDISMLFTDEIRSLVKACVDRMPELTRQVFNARKQEELSYREIAQRLHITERRVETELEKSKEQLRKALQDYLPATALSLFIMMIH